MTTRPQRVLAALRALSAQQLDRLRQRGRRCHECEVAIGPRQAAWRHPDGHLLCPDCYSKEAA